MDPYYKKIAVFIIIGFMLVMMFRTFNQPGNSVSMGYSDFIDMLENESVSQVTIQGNKISGLSVQGPFNTFAPKDPELIQLLKSKGIQISAKSGKGSSWSRVLLSWVPMLLLVGVWIFFMRRMQGGGGNILSFGKSRAKLMSDSQKKVTFEDVAGIDEAMEELQEIIDFLRDPGRFT